MTVQVKICGLSTPETLNAAIEKGTSHVGFVHHRRSVRHVSLDRLVDLRRLVPKPVVPEVVVVDPDDTLIDALAPLDVVLQLHKVGPERAAAIRRRWTGEVWVDWPVRSADDLVASAVLFSAADRVLFDAPTDPLEVPGGTGRSFDWSLLSGQALDDPWVLSGGLDAGNVGRAIAKSGADFVDVSSGVESAPGVKDVDKMAAFLTACGR